MSDCGEVFISHPIKTCIFKLILALKLASQWTVALPNTPVFKYVPGKEFIAIKSGFPECSGNKLRLRVGDLPLGDP